MMKNQRIHTFTIIILSILLSSCFNRDMSDLEKKVHEIKAKKNVTVAALPIYKPTFPAIFKGGKDPFESFLQSKVTVAEDIIIKNKICPRQPRSEYRVQVDLEKFPLDSLKMKGSFRDQDGTLWALVIDPKGVMYTVREGYFMGQNFGKIIAVSEEEIDLEEKYPDEKVCWITKETKVKLIEANTK